MILCPLPRPESEAKSEHELHKPAMRESLMPLPEEGQPGEDEAEHYQSWRFRLVPSLFGIDNFQ